MCMMFSQCNTCSMVILTIQYQGSVATSRAMPTPFYLSTMKLASSGFMYIQVEKKFEKIVNSRNGAAKSNETR